MQKAENIAKNALKKFWESLNDAKNLKQYDSAQLNEFFDRKITVIVLGDDALVAYSKQKFAGGPTVLQGGQYNHHFKAINLNMYADKVSFHHIPENFRTDAGRKEMKDDLMKILKDEGVNEDSKLKDLSEKIYQKFDSKFKEYLNKDQPDQLKAIEGIDFDGELEKLITRDTLSSKRVRTKLDPKTVREALQKSILVTDSKELKTFATNVNKQKWSFENCAEWHALQAFSRKESWLRGNTVTRENAFLATFEVENRNDFKDLKKFNWGKLKLRPKPTCSQCTFLTRRWNVVTDPKPNERISDSCEIPEKSAARNKRSIPFNFFELGNLFGFGNTANLIDTDPLLQGNKNVPIQHFGTNSSSPKANTVDSSMKRLYNWIKNTTDDSSTHVPAIPNTNSFNSPAPQFKKQFDTNGVLILFDLFVRKITGEKFVSAKDLDELSPEEVQAQAISILTQFEDLLTEVAEKSHLTLQNFSFDPIIAQNKIIDQMRNGKFSQIPEILYNLAKQSNADFEYNAEFLTNLKRRLVELFDTKNTSRPELLRHFSKYPAPNTRIENSIRSFTVDNGVGMHQNLLNRSDILSIN